MATLPSRSYSAPAGRAIYAGRWPNGSARGGVIADGGGVGGSAASNFSLASGGVTADSGAVGGSVDGAFIPSWVPSTAWEWTDIAGTVWNNYMKPDGSGIAPAITAADPGPDRSYTSQWAYSGPCYSRARHEVYMLGGGHAATTINAVSRWNLNQDLPDVTLVSAPSSEASRNTYLQNEDWRTTSYLPDGKPASPHSYRNNWYCDGADEFVSFGIAGTATGYPTASGGNAGSFDIAALTRAGTWRAEGYYGDVTYSGGGATNRGPRMGSDDGTTMYYWNGPQGDAQVDLRKFVHSTNTHTTIGASVIPYYSMQADGGSGTALVIGGANSSAGWQAKFVTLSTAATVDVTVSGDSISSGYDLFEVTWCESHGYYLCIWVNNPSALFGGTITSMIVATITPTGSNTATASIKTMTGTAPASTGGWRGAWYDPTFDCVIFSPGPSHLLKAFKVN